MAEVTDHELSDITKQQVVSAFLQTIQRPLNCLSAEEQQSRRNALEKLHECLLKDDGAGSLPPMDVLQAAWDEVILEKVLRCVSDPTEKCRELAINLIREVAQSLTEVDHTLKETVTVMAERMGQEKVLESSEEIRLQLYSLLIDALLPECELPTLQAIVDPLHRIVAVTLFDQFHEVQKRACRVIVTMASRDPEVFGNRTEIFLRALVPCLSHSHSRVRIAVFQAIDSMMQCGLTKGLVAQQLGPGTKSLAFDHTAAVRELFFESVANWLNYKMSVKSDEEIKQDVLSGKIPRFHLPELLPLLLLGITDDCLDIATSTYEKLEAIGEIYKKFIDHLNTRLTEGPGGQRYRTAEEDDKIMEKVMEEDRKCQERYEQEMREEQQRSQKGNDANSTSSQEISLYQSLRSQTEIMEKEMAKETDTHLQEEKDEEEIPTVPGGGTSGLHILTNQGENDGAGDYQHKQQGGSTSEITDEGAVQKLENGELQLPLPYQGRPGAGCRLMVEAFLRPMIEPVLKELKQWTTPTRLCAARMLHTLMVLAEVLAKDNLDILIPAFLREHMR